MGTAVHRCAAATGAPNSNIFSERGIGAQHDVLEKMGRNGIRKEGGKQKRCTGTVLHMRVKKRVWSVNQTALERNGPPKWTWKGTGDGWVRCQQHCLGKLGLRCISFRPRCPFGITWEGPGKLMEDYWCPGARLGRFLKPGREGELHIL